MNTSIGSTIKSQVPVGVWMSLGASHFKYLERGLEVKIRVLPFTTDGERSPYPSTMTLTVTLSFLDLYDIRVEDGRNLHYSECDIYADMLGRRLYALDYDGAEVLNPRLF